MRILVLTPTYFPIKGGAELLIYEVYRRISQVYPVLILTPRLPGSLVRAYGVEQEKKGSGVKVVYFGDPLNPLKLRGHRLTKGLIPPFSLSAIGALRKEVKDFRPDVIHAFYAIPTGLAAVLVQLTKGVPIVLSFIGRDIPGPGTPLGWKYYDRLIARLAKEVTYLSDYCRISLYGSLTGGKGRTICGGVDVARFHPDLDGTEIKTELSIGLDTTVLFSVQRLSFEKRVDVLIQSMPYLLECEPNVVLVIGGKGPDAGKLKRLSQALGVDDKVLFVGYISDRKLPLYFAMADIFVFHTTHETFGIVLAEAMASGKPIVSVRTTAVPEIVKDGVNGLLVEPLNPLAFAEGVLKLIKEKELRTRLGQSGRERAVRLFDWDKIAKQYEEVLHTAIIQPHSGVD